MILTGHSFIGSRRGNDSTSTWQASNPANGEALAPTYYGASQEDLKEAVALATDAFQSYSQTSGSQRAEFLRTIAKTIEGLTDEIVPRMNAETALPEGRCQGETGRTCGQLRLFADLLDAGWWVDARIDTAQPDRQPLPKPDLRSMRRPLGPVAVFCASNFPLAFSVAGGDTASALAAGCPVIVRAHSSHPGTAEIVASAIQSAAKECNLPAGVFSLLYDHDRTLASGLVQHPGIKAVGFTGSRQGGRALMDLAAARPEPIPVYAEMSSINPIFILPGALAENHATIAKGLAGSVSMGVGQFCTSPGIVFAPGNQKGTFHEELAAEFSALTSAPMLHQGIAASYSQGLSLLSSQTGVEAIAQIPSDESNCLAGPAVLKTTVTQFLENPALSEEVFGPTSLIVACDSLAEMITSAQALEGQLTATVHGTEEDLADASELLHILAQKAGRVIINGFPTGVEVCHSIVHGGPYPSTSDGSSTSVGTGAINRFTRAVSWQNFPDSALPEELQSSNPLKITRLLNGTLSTDGCA